MAALVGAGVEAADVLEGRVVLPLEAVVGTVEPPDQGKVVPVEEGEGDVPVALDEPFTLPEVDVEDPVVGIEPEEPVAEAGDEGLLDELLPGAGADDEEAGAALQVRSKIGLLASRS